jgi:hypothetical protein
MNAKLGKIREEVIVGYLKTVFRNFRKEFRIVTKTLKVSRSVEILTSELKRYF